MVQGVSGWKSLKGFWFQVLSFRYQEFEMFEEFEGFEMLEGF